MLFERGMLLILVVAIIGAALFGWGALLLVAGGYAGYYQGVNQPVWWTYMTVLGAGAALLSLATSYRWAPASGPMRARKSPLWSQLLLLIPVALVLAGITTVFTAVRCSPPQGLLWPVYCGSGPSSQQATGAVAVLLGFVSFPALAWFHLSRRTRPDSSASWARA